VDEFLHALRDYPAALVGAFVVSDCLSSRTRGQRVRIRPAELLSHFPLFSMATFQAPAVVGQALRNLLSESAPRTVFPGVQFSLCVANNLTTPPFPDLGISLYLHRVTHNVSRRNLPPRLDSNGERFKPSVPLDLHFLVTAWARRPETQWALLAWAIRVFEDSPILPSGFLNQNAGSDTSGEALQVFREDESVELVGEILSLQDATSIWEIARHNQQPSVSFVARSVLIDSEIELSVGRPVQSRAFDLATPSR